MKKKKFLATMLAMTVTYGTNSAFFANANDIVETDVEYEDFSISENFDVVDSDNNLTEITANEEIINEISNEDVIDIIEAVPEASEIVIESKDGFENLDEVPECSAVIDEDGEVINVVVSENVINEIEAEEIIDIIENNDFNSMDILTIDNVVEYDTADSIGTTLFYTGNSESTISPEWKWYDLWVYIKTTRSYGSEYKAKDVFIASAARGETYSLTKKFESSLSLSLESGVTYDGVSAKAGMTNKVTCSVEKNHKYAGPPEESKYNSREYRVRFMAKKCTVKQAVKGAQSKHTTNYKAVYKVPSRYISYSIDKTVK